MSYGRAAATMTAFLTAQLGLDEAAQRRPAREARRPPSRTSSSPRTSPPERSTGDRGRRRSRGHRRDLLRVATPFASYPQAGGSPNSSLAAQLIGFVNREGAGPVRRRAVLPGRARRRARRSSRRTATRTASRLLEPSERSGRACPGEDIRLTIDARPPARRSSRRSWPSRIANGAKAVSAVVMDPWTGEIYAEASYPSYDANDYATIAADDPSRFADPIVSQVYEPGLGVQDVHGARRSRAGDHVDGHRVQGHGPPEPRRRRGAESGTPTDGPWARCASRTGSPTRATSSRRRSPWASPHRPRSRRRSSTRSGRGWGSARRPGSTSRARCAASSTIPRSPRGARSTWQTARSARAWR